MHGADNPYATLTPQTTFFAPFSRTFEEIRGKVHRADNDELVDIDHRTMKQCLSDYFQHPNYKAAHPRHIGLAARRHVQVTGQVFIGKETNRVLEELEEESEGVLQYPDAEVYARTDSGAWLRPDSTAAVARATGLSKRQVRRLKNGAHPRPKTRWKLLQYKAGGAKQSFARVELDGT